MSLFDKSKTIKITIVLLLIVGAIGLYNVLSKDQLVQTEINVALKWLHQAQFAGMYMAQDLGKYDDNNLTVDLVEYQQGTSIIDLVETGEMDFGIVGANDLLTAIDSGSEIKAIAAIYQASPYVIASLKGDNILTPRDLKGKRLGVKGGMEAEGFQIFQLVTTSAGLDQSDVEYVSLDFSTTEKQDLLEERVDAIGLYRTRLYQFEQEGINFNAIYPEQYGTPVYNDVIFARSELIEQNPEIVKAFLDATITGWAEVIKNPEVAVDVVMARINNEQYKDRAYQLYTLSTSIPLIKPSRKSKIGDMSLDRWTILKKALVSRNAISSKFDIESAFTTKFLR